MVTVRPAAENDVLEIFRLLELYADTGIVLRRNPDDIRFFLGNFVVAEFDGKVCGCGAMRDFGGNLLEVRSLVVDPACQGKGIGRAIVEAMIAGLKLRRPEWRLFTLTLQDEFFKRLGFRVVDRHMFPEKIWSDCSKCPKHACCDEIAMLLESKTE